MLQRLAETAGLPQAQNDLFGRVVLAAGVLSLSLAVAGTFL